MAIQLVRSDCSHSKSTFCRLTPRAKRDAAGVSPLSGSLPVFARPRKANEDERHVGHLQKVTVPEGGRARRLFPSGRLAASGLVGLSPSASVLLGLSLVSMTFLDYRSVNEYRKLSLCRHCCPMFTFSLFTYCCHGSLSSPLGPPVEVHVRGA